MTTDMDTVITKNKDSNLDAQSFNEGGGRGSALYIVKKEYTSENLSFGGRRERQWSRRDNGRTHLQAPFYIEYDIKKATSREN